MTSFDDVIEYDFFYSKSIFSIFVYIIVFKTEFKIDLICKLTKIRCNDVTDDDIK